MPAEAVRDGGEGLEERSGARRGTETTTLLQILSWRKTRRSQMIFDTRPLRLHLPVIGCLPCRHFPCLVLTEQIWGPTVGVVRHRSSQQTGSLQDDQSVSSGRCTAAKVTAAALHTNPTPGRPRPSPLTVETPVRCMDDETLCRGLSLSDSFRIESKKICCFGPRSQSHCL